MDITKLLADLERESADMSPAEMADAVDAAMRQIRPDWPGVREVLRASNSPEAQIIRAIYGDKLTPRTNPNVLKLTTGLALIDATTECYDCGAIGPWGGTYQCPQCRKHAAEEK